MPIITENNSKIKVELPMGDVSKRMEIFYNPAMESSRNLSVLLLQAISNKKMNLALPLAGSGITAIRFIKELKKNKINHLFVNDIKSNFIPIFNENLRLNSLKNQPLASYQEDANLFLLNRLNDNSKPPGFCGYFDYVDIDPFGSPNPFISSAIARISRTGILAITATDTAALTGTYPNTTRRKYWADINKNYLMHELGLRIIIRKVQLQGMQFDKTLIPILAYHKDHYFRIFFRSGKGKSDCDQIVKQLKYFLFNPTTLDWELSSVNFKIGYQSIGPLWAGKLFDKSLLKKMIKINTFIQERKFLQLLAEEKDSVGFYDLHEISKRYRIKTPKLEQTRIKLNGTRTHFSTYGIKTNHTIKEIVNLLQ